MKQKPLKNNISYRLAAVNCDMWGNYYVLIKSTEDGGKTFVLAGEGQPR